MNQTIIWMFRLYIEEIPISECGVLFLFCIFSTVDFRKIWKKFKLDLKSNEERKLIYMNEEAHTDFIDRELFLSNLVSWLMWIKI